MDPRARQRLLLTKILFVMLLGAPLSTPAVGQDAPDRSWLKQSRRPATRSTAELPDAHGRTFRTLDAYLAHLRRFAGPVGRPWYREVRPGVYRLETGNLRRLGGGPPERLFTREELERKFGFRR